MNPDSNANTPVVRWKDEAGVLRCNRWHDSYRPMVATSVEFSGFAFVIGDFDLAKREAERRAREARS